MRLVPAHSYPAVHSSHAEISILRIFGLKYPAAQGIGWVFPGHHPPAGQSTLCALVAPARQKYPAAQLGPVASIVGLAQYVLTSQGVGATDPSGQ